MEWPYNSISTLRGKINMWRGLQTVRGALARS
jgi:hypothetical protein